MAGFPWWSWIVLGGALGLAEMVVPGAYLMWIALGAAITAVTDAWFGLLLEGQFAVFAVATSISCIVGYFVYGSMQPSPQAEQSLNDPHRAMIGARGIVYEAFSNGRGKVRVGDTVWLATGPDLAVGAPVVVGALDGTRLVVQELQPRPAADVNGAAPVR